MGVKEYPINCLLEQREIAHLGKEIFLELCLFIHAGIRDGC